ncbi:MAG TPA: MBL fold metallo-hydrolase [Phototrophicaceae bacterium]|nr:MBL fold metallo-hydrolase [Phototrophicaceae bacterium]
MTISIKYVTLGIAATNAYLIGDSESNQAILIDPVDQAETLKAMADDSGWTIKLILATHAHFDHVLASKALKELTGAPFYIHAEAAPWLKTLPESGLRFVGKPFPEAATPDRLLTTEPETLTLGAITLETLYTPGHAPGHLSFYMRDQGVVFSGDSLFAGTVGRTDLPGGDHALLIRSIREQLLPLPDDTTVLPGHGEMTTIGQERATNPFLVKS